MCRLWLACAAEEVAEHTARHARRSLSQKEQDRIALERRKLVGGSRPTSLTRELLEHEDDDDAAADLEALHADTGLGLHSELDDRMVVCRVPAPSHAGRSFSVSWCNLPADALVQQ